MEIYIDFESSAKPTPFSFVNLLPCLLPCDSLIGQTVTAVTSVSIPRFIRFDQLRSTHFEYNTVQEILTNIQVSVPVTLKIAAISVMIPYKMFYSFDVSLVKRSLSEK